MSWVIASGNAKKIEEIGQILEAFELALLSPRDLGVALDVEEPGDTFAENALRKAHAWALETNRVAIADDSGLEVAGLDWQPGVHSARYAGPEATDEENNEKLAGEVAHIGETERKARYRCVIAVAWPNALVEATDFSAENVRTIGHPSEIGPDDVALFDGHWVETYSGALHGSMRPNPRGTSGFGYDPYFELGDGRRVAELTPGEKHAISHRGEALRKLTERLQEMPALRRAGR